MNLLEIAERPSPNYGHRDEPMRIDMLVLHYTGMTTASAALNRLCDPAARVSAHYLIDEDGAIWRLVSETRCAFHAGRSCWAGEHDLNRVSIGIEIVNPGHEWGYRPFPEQQMAAVERLCLDLVSRFSIPPHRVVGHSDIAPDRKSDPGELFDWPRLARNGIGVWPPAGAETARGRGKGVGLLERAASLADLAMIGYCVIPGSEALALTAFQRRFRAARWDGRLDAETAQRLAEVRTVYDRARRR